jgi:hypothetical protein
MRWRRFSIAKSCTAKNSCGKSVRGALRAGPRGGLLKVSCQDSRSVRVDRAAVAYLCPRNREIDTGRRSRPASCLPAGEETSRYLRGIWGTIGQLIASTLLGLGGGPAASAWVRCAPRRGLQAVRRGAAPWSWLGQVTGSAAPRVSEWRAFRLPDGSKTDSREGRSRGGNPGRSTLEDVRDFNRLSTAAPRAWSPRIDSDRLTLRQPRPTADRRRNPAWDDAPGRRRAGPDLYFEGDHAALRRMLRSLAAEGYRLVHGPLGVSPRVIDRQLGSFLRRLDRCDELAAERGLEPVRRWAGRLRSLVLNLHFDG